MNQTYIVIDDDAQSTLKTQAVASRFEGFVCVATASNYSDGINVILEHLPKIVFLEIDPSDKTSNLSLMLINELHRYLTTIPKIIVVTKYKDFAYEAVKYDVLDYYTKPLGINELRKSILKMEKLKPSVLVEKQAKSILETAISDDTFSVLETISTPIITEEPVSFIDFSPIDTIDIESNDSSIEVESNVDEFPKPTTAPSNLAEKPLIICVKSYGDYRFLEAKNICYLQADNNSTDIHLHNGEMITAFKTLKHFENLLQSPFVRIHNSYIVNIDYVTRIHTGNAVCYVKHTITKLPFSKSYKENVDAILSSISNGNYLEI